ncbi:hypothetical protein [Nonomuraea dietziae]|uniref:hypothetical protein n=1 Tax=Nonomuraea dietziae TaxID=65515 RepID=UPI0031D52900
MTPLARLLAPPWPFADDRYGPGKSWFISEFVSRGDLRTLQDHISARATSSL